MEKALFITGKNRYFMAYQAPPQTRIGHVHLKVADLERALKFYRDLLGFEITMYYGDSAVFLSAGGYHHHIGLNTWYSKGADHAPANRAGLFHLAIVYPTRKDLAVMVKRLMDAKYPLSGASDHGISQAVYLNDPDRNGVELYWDRPPEEWPKDKKGRLQVSSVPLDLYDLIQEIEAAPSEEAHSK